MKQQEFWNKVEERVQENQQIVAGGMSPGLAPILEKVGLHFWKIGLGLALIPTLWLWGSHYSAVMSFVREIVWR